MMNTKKLLSSEKQESIYERLRRESLTRYYKAPSHCKQCAGVIWVPDGKRVSDIKKRKFCSLQCNVDHKVAVTARRQAPPEHVKSVVRVSDLKETLVARRLDVEPPRLKKRKTELALPTINPKDLRTCRVCGEDYDVKTRLSKPGRLTNCNDCADEPEEKYHGNWVPAGTSTGSNLHQWGLVPTKGAKHVAKTSVG